MENVFNFIIRAVMIIWMPLGFVLRLVVRVLKDVLSDTYGRLVKYVGGFLFITLLVYIAKLLS